jgi:hypothetical protein
LRVGLTGTLIALIVVAPLEAQEASRTAQPGIVLVIGGVGGLDILGASACAALPRAGVRHDVREFVWTHGWGHFLRDLQDSQHLQRKAEELANRLRRLKADNPDRPLFLLAKSGGTGLALRAAEMLPANTLERMILLSAAVSPGYDLRRALMATRQEIVSFHSPYDQLMLNFGTRGFGTVDRVYGPSAGLRGFVAPTELDAADWALYQRLVQVPWNSRMLLQGHNGMHSGTSLPTFRRPRLRRGCGRSRSGVPSRTLEHRGLRSLPVADGESRRGCFRSGSASRTY